MKVSLFPASKRALNQYKFLGVLEPVRQEERMLLECTAKEFLRRMSIIWSSPLSDHNQVTNQFALQLLRPVYTSDFCRGNSMQFLSHQNCIRFQTCSKPLRYRADISHWESHLVYTYDFEVATLARQKLHRVAASKIACVNGPLRWSASTSARGVVASAKLSGKARNEPLHQTPSISPDRQLCPLPLARVTLRWACSQPRWIPNWLQFKQHCRDSVCLFLQ